MSFSDSDNDVNEFANMQIDEPSQAPGRQQVNEFLQDLIKRPPAHRPTRLEVLHKMRRLETV